MPAEMHFRVVAGQDIESASSIVLAFDVGKFTGMTIDETELARIMREADRHRVPVTTIQGASAGILEPGCEVIGRSVVIDQILDELAGRPIGFGWNPETDEGRVRAGSMGIGDGCAITKIRPGMFSINEVWLLRDRAPIARYLDSNI